MKNQKIIKPHIHKRNKRIIEYTSEVLIIRKGKIRADIFDCGGNYLESYILCSNDIIILMNGGHGFEVIENVEMIEVKQGPFIVNQDKIGIDKVRAIDIKLK